MKYIFLWVHLSFAFFLLPWTTIACREACNVPLFPFLSLLAPEGALYFTPPGDPSHPLISTMVLHPSLMCYWARLGGTITDVPDGWLRSERCQNTRLSSFWDSKFCTVSKFRSNGASSVGRTMELWDLNFFKLNFSDYSQIGFQKSSQRVSIVLDFKHCTGLGSGSESQLCGQIWPNLLLCCSPILFLQNTNISISAICLERNMCTFVLYSCFCYCCFQLLLFWWGVLHCTELPNHCHWQPLLQQHWHWIRFRNFAQLLLFAHF